MKLAVYSLKKVLFSGEARLVNCKTAMGVITILNNHQPLIGMLAAGTMKVVAQDNQEHFFDVAGGFFEIKAGNEARFLVD